MAKKDELQKKIEAMNKKLEKEFKEEERKKKLEEEEKIKKETPELLTAFPRSPIFKEVKKLKTDIPSAPIIPYEPIIYVRGIKGKLLRNKLRKMSSQYVIARIFTLNKRVVEFYVPSELEGFRYKKGRYIFDDTVRYWNETSKMNCYDFQEPLCISSKLAMQLPVEVKTIIEKYNIAVQKGIPCEVDVEDMKRVFELEDYKDIENAVNPIVLERYLKSDFVKSLVGGSLQKILRILMVLGVLALVFIFVDTILDFYSSGLLDQMKKSIK